MKKLSIQEKPYVRLIHRGVQLIEGTINVMVLLLFVGCIAFGAYAMWDSNQLYVEADTTQYEQYKPIDTDTRSFAELKEINTDVIGWISVYGTNIDYPLVQTEDNETYVNTSITGEKVLSGSIFLDYRNRPDFSDFNSIIYGHHMDRALMFGDIGEFQDEEYFKERRYGRLYNGTREYGIEFFAFVEADGYDRSVYAPAITEMVSQQDYLEGLLGKALYSREVEGGSFDRLVLLSTCASSATNGRHILVGRLSDTLYEDPFMKEGMTGEFGTREGFWSYPIFWWFIAMLTIANVALSLSRSYEIWKERRAESNVVISKL
jgi:sortase, SrtB family